MVIVVNTTVGVIQEVRADRAVTALATLSAPRARVIRDGRQTEIPAADVVPGDALVLAEGDLVAADAELVESAALLVDESSVTGESVAVDKAVGSVDRAADDHCSGRHCRGARSRCGGGNGDSAPTPTPYGRTGSYGGLTFEPAAGATRMSWSWEVSPSGPLRLFGPLVTRLGRHQEQAIWTGLKAHLEESGTAPTATMQ